MTQRLEELRLICPAAEQISEAEKNYFLLPGLRLPEGREIELVDGLLCIGEHTGYPTRLFLSQKLKDRGNNWNEYRILDRLWYSWSWKGIPADQSPSQILTGHLQALR
jgi:hypothetical protein